MVVGFQLAILQPELTYSLASLTAHRKVAFSLGGTCGLYLTDCID